MAGSRPGGGLASTATHNVVATVVVRVSSLAVGMILTPFLLGRVGTEVYGVLVVTGSTFEYLSLLRGGIGNTLRRYVTRFHHAGDHEMARQYYAAGFWWAAILRTGVLLVGIGLASPLSSFLRVSPKVRADCVMGVALIIVATVIADASTMLEIPTYATTRTAMLSAARGVVTWLKLALVVLAFHLLGAGLSVYGIAVVGTSLVSVVILAMLAQRSGTVGPAIPKPEFGAPEVRRELFRYGGLSILNQGAEVLYLSTDNLLIGRFFGAAAVAHYSMGARWYPLIYSFLSVPISALTPLFTSLDARGETERSRAALKRIIGVASVLAIPACLAPCVIGDLFLSAWVGPQYRDASIFMTVMLVPLALDVALAPVWMALYARGRIGLVVALIVPVAIGNVGLSLLLGVTLGMGPLGFAIGNGAALLARNAGVLVWLARRPDPLIPPVRQSLAPLLRALLGGLPGLGLIYLARGFIAGSLPHVVATATLGALVCLAGAALATFGPRGIRELAGTGLAAFGLNRRAAASGEPPETPRPDR